MATANNSFVKYAVLPGIIPRLRDILTSGFAFFAALVAVIYHNVGLIPAGHEYLDNKNMGRFGLRHVLAEAANNLKFSRNHIDQIIIYFTILIGMVAMAVQIVLLVLSYAASPVLATTFTDIFINTPGGHNAEQDIAFIVLDHIFGVEIESGTTAAGSFFGSCYGMVGVDCYALTGAAPGTVIPTPSAFPQPMHFALHRLLYFYTLGIAFLAGIVILYFITTIIGETVTSGTPFGQRFNKAWVVPRLIVFFALIAPITTTAGRNNEGINVAQLIVFGAAKYGSNMATNTWLQFNDNLFASVTDFLGGNKQMVALMNTGDTGGLTQFMHIVRMCIVAEKIINGIDVYPYIVRSHNDSGVAAKLHDGTSQNINQMGGTTDDYLDFSDNSVTFEQAVVFSRYKTVVLRFGHRNPPLSELLDPSGVTGAPVTQIIAPNNRLDTYDNEWGYVEPTCGELHFELQALDPMVIGPLVAGGGPPYAIQESYFEIVRDYMGRISTAADETVMCMVKSVLPYSQNSACVDENYSVGPGDFSFTSNTKWLTVFAARSDIEFFNTQPDFYMFGKGYDWNSVTQYAPPYAFSELQAELYNPAYKNNLRMPTNIRRLGWAGAALWYNRIAELNGLISGAVQNKPMVFKYPKVMEIIADQHRTHDSNFSFADRFNPRLQNGQMAKLPRPGDQYLAAMYYGDFGFWRDTGVQETVKARGDKNAILDFLNTVFGTQGLVNVLENKGTHPLAMLSSMGKGLVDASLRNLFLGIVGQGVGELLSDNFIGATASVAGEFIVTLSLLTLTIGFMLYYVLPFMPFIYFFFAFSGWIKSIFEAIVAMPLWAVAHIKIDGEGLPGPLASNGYFLIFEIFLRPTLIICGLIASISLFTALVDTLHDVFHIVTMAATGYDLHEEILNPTTLPNGESAMDYWRSPIDELFYTVIYVATVYMIGLSCFKLIDEIPNNILRWMGVTVSTFQENAGDPAGELSQKMYRSTQMANAQITTAISRIKDRDKGQDTLVDTAIATSL